MSGDERRAAEERVRTARRQREELLAWLRGEGPEPATPTQVIVHPRPRTPPPAPERRFYLVLPASAQWRPVWAVDLQAAVSKAVQTGATAIYDDRVELVWRAPPVQPRGRKRKD